MRGKILWKALLLTGLLLALTPGAVAAHGGDPHGAEGVWDYWSFDPGIGLGLGLSALLYVRGWRALARRPGGVTGQRRWQTWAFAAGLLVLVIALFSPVDGIAGELFWAHMLQHNLLMLVAAPLLVLSYPLPPMLLGLPPGARQRIGQGWNRQGWLRWLWRGVSQPAGAWLIHLVMLWGWHAPGLYQASVENDLVHALQHLSFLGSALLFWWVTLHTFGARAERRGMGILYLFTTALQAGLLGALITFSSIILYPVYVGRTEHWGLTPLEDQQLAGLIMWIPGGLFYLLAALWMMKTWLESFQSEEVSG